MNKHTAGPWKVEEYQKHFEIWPDVTTGGVQIIAKTHTWESEQWKEDDRANAFLIAAAPEMIEALKYLYDFCLNNIPNMSEYGIGSQEMRAARIAIAKAGESC